MLNPIEEFFAEIKGKFRQINMKSRKEA